MTTMIFKLELDDGEQIVLESALTFLIQECNKSDPAFTQNSPYLWKSRLLKIQSKLRTSGEIASEYFPRQADFLEEGKND